MEALVGRDPLDRLHQAAGGGGLVADRLLPEIAYKVGRAPKYGA